MRAGRAAGSRVGNRAARCAPTEAVVAHGHPPESGVDARGLKRFNSGMRLVPPITYASAMPTTRQPKKPRKMRAPSRLPTVYPTQSSYLRRLLWALGFGR